MNNRTLEEKRLDRLYCQKMMEENNETILRERNIKINAAKREKEAKEKYDKYRELYGRTF